MKKIMIDQNWQIHYSTGQRGGLPHMIKSPGNHQKVDLYDYEKQYNPNEYNPSKWLSATVPGNVHADLLKHGLIDDPYIGMNVYKCRWVEEQVWFYRTTFDASEFHDKKNVVLTFKCLDINAIVYLNGKEAARHNNSFYPLNADVTGKLLEGENVLEIRLESGLFYVSEKKARHLYTAIDTPDLLLHKRMWLRKPQSSFEWDWSPRLINIGIPDEVFITYDDRTVFTQNSVSVVTKPDLSCAGCTFKVDFTGKEPEKTELFLNGKKIEFATALCRGNLSLKFNIENPTLWQPLGYGEQYMYELKAVIDGNIFEKAFGVRYVEIDQSPTEKGKRFNVIVNHRRIFAKGSNFVPVDMIDINCTKEKYEKTIQLALDANFNFLRVWGGGRYESDYFYELCDKHGILVWQEFICACSCLPYDDEEFKVSVIKEFTYHVKRLSNHPSLIIWCGNNELNFGFKWVRKGEDMVDGLLYDVDLPAVLKEHDSEKYYQPTSPWSPDENVADTDDSQGDQHPWLVGFDNKDHRLYRDMECTFPNEGGVLGPSSKYTMLKCLEKGQEYLHSFSFDLHDNMLESLGAQTSADHNVLFWFDKNPSEMPLESYIYYGGLVHGEGLSEYILNFRRREFDTGSAIFWMYNDCWPTTRSWTIVDYYQHVTPAFYYVKRAFANLALTISFDNGEYTAFAVNDYTDEICGKLKYGVFTPEGEYLYKNEKLVTISGGQSTAVVSFDGNYPQNAVAYAVLYGQNDEILARARHIKCKYHELGLAQNPKISIQKSKAGYALCCEHFVLGVCLDIDGEKPLSDNMFDLYPNQKFILPTDDRELKINFPEVDLSWL